VNEPYLAIGPGATGKTHWLRAKVENLGVDPTKVAWLSGRPRQYVSSEDLGHLVKPDTEVLAADDIQWFTNDALDQLVERRSEITIVATRRPSLGDEPALVDDVTELLGATNSPNRLGLLDIDQFAPVYAALRHSLSTDSTGGATPNDELERIYSLVGGSVGLASDIVAARWDGSTPVPPRPVVDAVQARITRAGAHAMALVDLLAAIDSASGSHTPLELALRVLPADMDASIAQRAVRSGGLVDEHDRLIPLVGLASRANKTESERAEVHDSLAVALGPIDPVGAAMQVLEGTGTLPDASSVLAAGAAQVCISDPALADTFIDRAEQLGLHGGEANLLRALGSFHAGADDALGLLDKAMEAPSDDGPDPRSAVLGYGLDMRDLRFSSAASRPIGGDLDRPLKATAGALVGNFVEPSFCADPGTPISELACAMALAVSSLGRGQIGDALALFGSASDDFDRICPTLPLGVTPHLLGAFGALLVGDLVAVEMFTNQAISNEAGGQGEMLGHQAVRAYAQVVGGQYNDTMELLRKYPATEAGDGSPNQRDRLLLAGLDAAVARRSGDTARLRAAWARAEVALLRPSASWYLIDIYTDLLAAGARLGDERRVEPVLAQLTAQCDQLPAHSPGHAAGHWLGLQIGVAHGNPSAVRAASDKLQGVDATDLRSKARVAGAAVWARLVEAEVIVDDVIGAAELLSSAGDTWEASRLLGQAALDCDDPKSARRMLELARISTTDQMNDAASDGLGALGLSEREAEVAKLISQGRTHKEAGAQLFISPKTVEHHVARIRQKLGATSRADLLAIIRQHID